MKVMLAAVNAKYIHSNLAIRYLYAYTKDLNYDCSLFEFSINDRKEKVLETIILEKPDIIAFSCYIWNIEFIKYLSTHIRLIVPECVILLGGPEVSYDSEKFLKESEGDFIAEGEGEETYRDFILKCLEFQDLKRVELCEMIARAGIKGLYAKSSGNIYYGGKRHLMDMKKIVFPYDSSMENLNNKIVYYEASRGCPFNCKYCLSSTTHGVRFHDIERIKKELDFFVENNVKLIKFVDRTFNCNKDFATSIWKYLISLDTDAKFHFEISADIFDEGELELLSKAPKGLFQFEVGVQTTNPSVLKNINRNADFSDIKEKTSRLEYVKNIEQHLDLIAGLPGENFSSFKKSFNDVFSIRPAEIQIGFLKLLKGSAMRNEASQWGMIYSPYPPYEILKTDCISYEELAVLKRVEETVGKYYNSNKFTNIINYFLPKYETPFDFFCNLGEFFHSKGLFDRNISSSDYYKVFIDFAEERHCGYDDLLLKEIIKFDYLKHNRKKWLPDFLIREIDKATEREIKLKAGKNVHVEKYFFNMILYIEKGIVKKEDCYLIYDEQSGEIKKAAVQE